MSYLFIPTNSMDGTCDALAYLLKESNQKFFRWNIDLWQHYEISFDRNGFFCADNTGRRIDATTPEILLVWRKPLVDLMGFDGLELAAADKEHARTQIGQWMQSVVALMKPQGRVRLIEPYADRRLPKLYQLYLAQDFFHTPRSHFGNTKSTAHLGPNTIVKPLGSPSVGSEKIFYTRRVNIDELCRPFPWFAQGALVEGHDVTCVYILGRSHFFVCDFVRSDSAIDWRVEINMSGQSAWHLLRSTKLPEWEDAVDRYMRHIGLHYGRLDFIMQGDVLYFLECNANGQFGWLDNQDTLYLHRCFLEAALNPASIVA